MALSRKFLSAMGIEADKIDEIINAHAESVDGLKGEKDSYKAKAEAYESEHKKVADLQKEIDGLKESTKESYKVKYEALKEEFGEYKKGIEVEKARGDKVNALKGLLKEIGVSEKRIDAVVKVSDVDAINLKDGVIDGADELKKSLADEWADFIVKTEKQGANTATPPANLGGKSLSREEIIKIKDTTERQNAWGQYIAEQQKGN